jgi:hypothetical protein
VLRAKPDVAGIVALLVIPAQGIAPACVVASLNQIDGNSRRAASTRFIAAPLPWFLTV